MLKIFKCNFPAAFSRFFGIMFFELCFLPRFQAINGIFAFENNLENSQKMACAHVNRGLRRTTPLSSAPG